MEVLTETQSAGYINGAISHVGTSAVDMMHYVFYYSIKEETTNTI